MNDPPEVGTLATLTHPPPANTLKGGLPPVTTKVCVLPLQAFGGAPVPEDRLVWAGMSAGGSGVGVDVGREVGVGVAAARNVSTVSTVTDPLPPGPVTAPCGS